MSGDGWFEIEEEVVLGCMEAHATSVFHPDGHKTIVRRRIRFTDESARRLIALVKREAEPDPRLFDTTRY